MRVLAVDPGYDRLGVAVMEHDGNSEKLIYSACIETDKNCTLPERIEVLGKRFEELLSEHRPDAVGIENLFFNKNIKTALGVAEARGVIVYLARRAGATVYEFGPQEIKIAVTGYGKSDKGAVIAMISKLITDAPKEGHDDEFDAIAVGITCLATIKNSIP